MALFLTRDDQISQDLIDEHDGFSTSSSRCIQFEIQAALIPDQNKFEYQSAQELVRTVWGFADSESAQEHPTHFHSVSDAEFAVIRREILEAGTMSIVRFTFEKGLNRSILQIRHGSAHHLIASTLGYEFAQKMHWHAIHGRGEYSVS